MFRNLIFLFGIVLISCSGSKKAMTVDEANGLETLIDNGEFQFEALWAFPRLTNSMVQLGNAGLFLPGDNAGRISLIGNPNYITFKNDSISAYMPYFGEQQISTTYGGQDIAIQFEDVAKELSFKPNKKNTAFEVEFSANDETESYGVFMQIFPDSTTTVFINSSHRFTIGYSGRIKLLSESGIKEKTETVFN